MSEYKDLLDMIEIITTAIEVQESAGESFNRCARWLSTSEVSRSLYLEIAVDLIEYREKFQARKKKLIEALKDLREAKQDNTESKASVMPVPYPDPDMLDNYPVCMPRDPARNMRVNPAQCQFVSTFEKGMYYFCCENCQKAFELSREKYSGYQPSFL